MPDQLDTVARAIWQAHTFGTPIEWGEITVASAIQYRRMARAAIDALGLTEDWAIRNGTGTYPMPEELARDKAGRWPESFCAITRLVSPWVKAED